MMRKWILVSSLVGLTAIGGAGLTLALFTDVTQPVTSNFVAGTLALEGNRVDEILEGPIFYISNEDGASGNRETGLWAPGDSHMREWQIENVGSLDARLERIMAEATATVSGEGGGDLADELVVTVKDNHDNELASDKLSAFYGVTGVALNSPIVLNPTDNVDLYITVSLRSETGNEHQGASVVVTFFAHAVQDKNN